MNIIYVFTYMLTICSLRSTLASDIVQITLQERKNASHAIQEKICEQNRTYT